MSGRVNVTVDGIAVEVEPGTTILQACEEAGVEIPRFCYHERLSVAGNCRMCLVEVEKAPKPVASCAMPVAPDMVVNTQSESVKSAREGVMEFLLINHPLDCPICDQGGECDLQDQAMAYGVDFSRFREPKRAVDDLDLGPLVGTQMTRCISCTRCVRFTSEVAGITQMGQTGRGEDAEITTYLSQTLVSELQGNIIDLCPVGALTSKPYSFTARPWELKKTETIDVMDALGSNILVDTKGREVMRILPRNHDGVNEEWLSDKSRFVWDGLRRQRLDKPYVRVNGKLVPATWGEAFTAIKTALEGKTVAGLIGDLVSTEAAFALQQLIGSLGGQVECRVDGSKLPIGNRSSYVGTATIEDIDSAEIIQLIGTNPRTEAPVLNARLRKAWINGANISLLGEVVDLTYEYSFIGADKVDLDALCSKDFDDVKDKPSLIIVGQGALQGADGAVVLAAAMELADKTSSKFMVLHTAAGRVGAMDLGCVSDGDVDTLVTGADVVFNLGSDENPIGGDPFVIYQGSHGDRGAHRADVILPAAAYTEESGIFVNTEGRPQMTARAGFPPGDARENWAVLRALSAELGQTLPFDSLQALRSKMFEKVPHLGAINTVPENEWTLIKGKVLKKGVLKNAITEHYLTNPIARASQVMGELAANASARKAPKLAAE